MENYKMLVTPEIAEKLLEKVPDYQRRESSAVVNFYADEMERGNWNDVLGGRIVLDENDMLMDGQHRLRAVVKSGTTHMFDVVRGVDSSDFAKIDVGKSRLVSDFAKIPNPQKHTTVASVILRFLRGRNIKGTMSSSTSNKVSAQDTIKFMNDNMNLVRDYVYGSANLKSRCSVERIIPYTVVRFVLENSNGEIAREFFSELSSDDCYQNQSIMRTITRIATTDKISMEEYANILFSGFEQYKRGGSGTIRVTKESRARFLALFSEVQSSMMGKE